ncbi:hypothetical protein EK0264_05455 [Epidermidibacterium keratini]|uniref:Uncharacterized protein n=1 Tax=Epidermidibacterium keratini TaxID=1891644 RepID=A0A7L4YL35_9ACTN|nr:hypothetical protein [Epidermidibacterium keratini]QHB99777.1 hypothetical protein EK0264_05455 [Epidermidibacterium keratini]
MTGNSERSGWRGTRLPPLPGRSARSRLWIGSSLVLVALLLGFLALVPLNFLHRIADRVDVTGTVKEGYGMNLDNETAFEIDDGEFGFWKVDYEIDGTPHTGLMRGSFSSGQTVEVSVPGDGSIYSFLSLADPVWVKILSWLSALAAVAALVIGVMCLVTGARQASRQAQARANAQIAASMGIPLREIEARQARPKRRAGRTPPPDATPQWQKSRTDTSPADPKASEMFHRPYDL